MGCVNLKKARKSFWKYGSELDNPDRVFYNKDNRISYNSFWGR